MSEYTNNNQALDWDSTIENDGQEFILLPEGDYNFIVTNLERGRYPGGEKMSACNKATLTLAVPTKDGDATVRTDLFLHRVAEWKLAAFFRCIGQKKKGEKLTMDWNIVLDKCGRAHFRQRTYKGKDGSERKTNEVAYFIDYDEKYFNDEKILRRHGHSRQRRAVLRTEGESRNVYTSTLSSRG